MSIEELKKSMTMKVWDSHAAIPVRREVVHIFGKEGCLDSNGTHWDYFEEINEPAYRPYNENDDYSNLLGMKIRCKNNHKILRMITCLTPEKIITDGISLAYQYVFENYEGLGGEVLGVLNEK